MAFGSDVLFALTSPSMQSCLIATMDSTSECLEAQGEVDGTGERLAWTIYESDHLCIPVHPARNNDC